MSAASYFASSVGQDARKICLIDTPGVNAALNRNHGKLAHAALSDEQYDMVLYVVCPTNLGTDGELKHLKWVKQHVPEEKVVFVLNKLDNFKDNADSIEESIGGFKDDLNKLGFKDPIICPISAYFSYLLKLKMSGQLLTEDEADEYAYLSKKFMRAAYDLSGYSENVKMSDTESEEQSFRS